MLVDSFIRLMIKAINQAIGRLNCGPLTVMNDDSVDYCYCTFQLNRVLSFMNKSYTTWSGGISI